MASVKRSTVVAADSAKVNDSHLVAGNTGSFIEEEL